MTPSRQKTLYDKAPRGAKQVPRKEPAPANDFSEYRPRNFHILEQIRPLGQADSVSPGQVTSESESLVGPKLAAPFRASRHQAVK